VVFAVLYHGAPEVSDAVKILKPETIIRWHRVGFRAWWRWKSRPRGGRPRTPDEICQLIRKMSVANPLWGAPRIHGEFLKLGMDVGQTTVAKYMAKRRRPPSQGWRTFVHNHADAIASIDMFVVPTISFRLLYGLLILRQSRREPLWLGVTAHPTAEWLARQLTEACGWDEPPRYLIRDRAGAYGAAFIRRIRAMGIRDRPVSARSARSDGNVLITSSSLASAIFATFSHRTKNTTRRSERTYRCRRTRRLGVMCAEQGACVRRRSWAGSTISIFEFEFPTGHNGLLKPIVDFLRFKFRARKAWARGHRAFAGFLLPPAQRR
jgi:hypothetical protein